LRNNGDYYQKKAKLDSGGYVEALTIEVNGTFLDDLKLFN